MSKELYRSLQGRKCLCGNPDVEELSMGDVEYRTCSNCGRAFTIYISTKSAEQTAGQD